MAQVLVLNKGYQPVSMISWQDAICLWYKDKAEILEGYEDSILHSWKSAMEMPCVIRLLYFVRPRKNTFRYQPFTRRNIYTRDEGKCQYCRKKITIREMSWDHVMPRSKGGKSNWKNIVCCCPECNRKKSSKTLHEAKMTLIRKPFSPTIPIIYEKEIIQRIKNLKYLPHEKWKDFIYWNVSLDEE